MLVIFYGARVIWLLLWHLWWKIHHPAVCNTVLTLKSGQQAASSLHTDGDWLTTGCLPFQTGLSAGLLLLLQISQMQKLTAVSSACLKMQTTCLVFWHSYSSLLLSNVFILWHIMVLQVGDWCIPGVVLSSFPLRIQLDLDCFVLLCFSGQKILCTIYKYISCTWVWHFLIFLWQWAPSSAAM